SLAVTGWVLGNVAAEAKVAVAERYWANRTFVLNYLRTHDAGRRRRELSEYQQYRPLALDEMTQLIALLPPPEPAEPAASGAAAGGAAGANAGPAPGSSASPYNVQERVTQVPGTQKRPVSYTLQLPPEYRPTRPYPLLIVLGNAGEAPAQALERWSAEGARN